MQDTDAVSCILCLRADEYGAMIKVCVPQGQNPPSPERVICRSCANAILLAGEKCDPGLADPHLPFDDKSYSQEDEDLAPGPKTDD